MTLHHFQLQRATYGLWSEWLAGKLAFVDLLICKWRLEGLGKTKFFWRKVIEPLNARNQSYISCVNKVLYEFCLIGWNVCFEANIIIYSSIEEPIFKLCTSWGHSMIVIFPALKLVKIRKFENWVLHVYFAAIKNYWIGTH